MMTEATQVRPTHRSSDTLAIWYRVEMPEPATHLFEVTLTVQGWQSDVLDLKLPVWTPGSYLIREYARHLQNFSVIGPEGQSLAWRKARKNHWQIETPAIAAVMVRYRIFANELSVRTNHLDTTHGYFNGAALFLYLPGYEHRPLQVTVVPPDPTWHVTTPLALVPGQANTFEAANYDTLVDSPFEIGRHARYDFDVLGKPHQLAVWGQGNLQPQVLIQDIQKVIAAEADLFGGLPYDRYLFLLHLSAQGNGGLEHKCACSLNYPRYGFRAQEKYQRFIQLVAHEFFHLWNVKRIRPKALETFDYDQENYTPSLWFSEGTTSYYDLLIPLRAGIYDAKTFLEALSKEITRYLTTPGRHVQPLQESSFDAWIKLYRADAHSRNSLMSYYLKGELVSLLLDLLIRDRHNNGRSLDDVLRQMWQQFGRPEIGFTPEQLQEVIESVAATDLSDFFDHALVGLDELPFDLYLEPFGLKLEANPSNSEHSPYLGITAKSEKGYALIQFVDASSPAQQAGIDPGDELLALDNIRVTAEALSDRLRDYQPGDTVGLTVFHQDELRTCAVTLESPRPDTYRIAVLENSSPAQEENFFGWTGESLPTLR